MNSPLSELAERYGGAVQGDPGRRIQGVSTLEQAGPADLSPLFEGRYVDRARSSRAAALLTDDALASRVERRPLWVHPTPRVALARLLEDAYPEPAAEAGGVHASAVVDPSARLHPTARVEALAVIGPGASVGARTLVGARAIVEAEVGADCRIGSGAMVLAGSLVGDRVRIGAGAIVGAAGFGFLPTGDLPLRVRQLGGAVIEDDVDLGALTVVARGTLGDTRIRRGAKLDSLIQVGHNVEIGPGAIIAAQAGFAGSARVGARALIGGQVGVADHLVVGDEAKVAAKSGLVMDVPPHTVVAGYPAMSRRLWLRLWASLRRSQGRAEGRER